MKTLTTTTDGEQTIPRDDFPRTPERNRHKTDRQSVFEQKHSTRAYGLTSSSQ
ncbi:MAG: hypothetical protein HZT41_06065 [Dechloromonas sp.]|nr:MAG: hypothetical protein HZT41_06065 [Dechloromonas sp.]